MWHRKGGQNKKPVTANSLPEQVHTASPPAVPARRELLAGAAVEQAPGAAAIAPGVPAAPGAWRMGLVVTASVLCGGIAVALWNRRLLTRMREVAPPARSDQQGRLWEDDV